MDQTTAKEILDELNGSAAIIDKMLFDLKDSFPAEPFRATKLMLGYFMSDMFDTLHTPIYNQHLLLAPDWYRDKPGAMDLDLPSLKMPVAMRDATLGAFEAAYVRVQAILTKVSALSDPAEVAMLSDGLHQISGRLCRARLALLRAEVE